jgi:hypothetical protein
MIERPTPVGEVLATLIGAYDVAADICRQDVTQLLAELVRERLIVIGDEKPR